MYNNRVRALVALVAPLLGCQSTDPATNPGFRGAVVPQNDDTQGPGDLVVTVSPTEAPADLFARFRAAPGDGSSTITGHQWDFGDGTSSSEASPTHIYTKPGSYEVTLTANVGGATEQASQMVHATALEWNGKTSTWTSGRDGVWTASSLAATTTAAP